MRDVLARRSQGDERVLLAFDVYIHRLVAGIAAMIASLGGLDALAFSGGVGEHLPDVRAAAAARLAFLGVAIDPTANAETDGADADISMAGAPVGTLVVRARVDLEIAGQVRAALGVDAKQGHEPGQAREPLVAERRTRH